jgi:hypothetical protein
MPEKKNRFVLLCQQLLTCGAVLAFAAPATAVVSLDIVAPAPAPVGVAPTAPRSGPGSLVAAVPVRPTVKAVRVTGVDPRGLATLREDGGRAAGLRLSSSETGDGDLAALTAPEPVTGLGTVGATWKPGDEVREADISVSVRTRTDGVWSQWQAVPYHDDHGPDAGSAESEHARPGTDPIYVGAVDDVQMKAVTATGDRPAGMQLDVVDPGQQKATVVEQPAIDTARLASAQTTTDPTSDPTATLAGTPAPVTPKPKIYSRAQWGADERMRDASSLHYGEVHAGFVHHTVNANGYTKAQVPSIIRGIYAYHTQSRGWSDIGYNFLVDRFGRIWEGRYGGVDRPVVGAHTLGYNDYAFAMSAIGNYDIYDKGRGVPSKAMLDAYGRLFAWKLSLHGVDAGSKRQWVGKRYLPAINGHRDVGQTACPGRYLYAKVPTIRALAAADQRSWAGRARRTDVAGSGWPDLVVRNKATKRVSVVRTEGQLTFGGPRIASRGWSGMDIVTPVRDVTGDGIGDVVARRRTTKVSAVYPGDGHGRFLAARNTTSRFQNLDQLVGVGDLNGDRRNDLVGRSARNHRLYLFPGNGKGVFSRSVLLSRSWGGYNLTVGAGDLTGDGHPDLLARSGSTLLLFPVTAAGRLKAPVRLSRSWGSYDVIAGLGDVTNDGRADLVVRKRASGLVYVYPGNGRGGVSARYGPFSGFRGVDFLAAAGQVTGNRGGDLVARDGSGRLVVFANSGRRNLGATTDTGRSFKSANLLLNVGDWNGDGHGDLMTRSGRSGNVYFYAGDGRGHFRRAVRAASGWSAVTLLTAVGDITGDGYPDLMGQPRGKAMRIYPGNGGTGFRRSYVAHAGVPGIGQLGVGLWTGDGSPDTMVRRSDQSVVLYRGNGPGGLTGSSRVLTGTGGYDWLRGVGDVDGDGHPDVVARKRTNGQLWLLPGQGSGFGPRRLIGTGFGGYDLVG